MTTYRFQMGVAKEVRVLPQAFSLPPNWSLSSDLELDQSSDGKLRLDRETFFSWLWERYSNSDHSQGLVGIHEGTVLSEDVSGKSGDEKRESSESVSSEPKRFEKGGLWVLDSALPPQERDWVGQQDLEKVDLYFSTEEEAQSARLDLQAICEGIQILSPVQVQKPQDWDAEWKANFLNQGKGIPIPPFWRVVPPWYEASAVEPGERIIRINPGEGFGTGTHETTQLCLRLIGEGDRATKKDDRNAGPGKIEMALDFGSGSGILSIGLALLGAKVDAVEIDPAAIRNAEENAGLNGVQDQIRFTTELDGLDLGKKYPLVVANILRPVLIQFAGSLISRLKPTGRLILSGLIQSDVEPILEVFCNQFGLVLMGPGVLELEEWRALVFCQKSYGSLE